ncbi:MAG: hypothetical protein R2708_10205 [Vicinamibacterales bacterium]
MRTLVFVHGRAQEGKDSVALKQEWIDAWHAGLSAAGLTPPPGLVIRFPYYGDALADLTAGRTPEQAADVIVRGVANDRDEARFMAAVLAEVQEQTGLTDAQIDEAMGADVVQRGPANWEWVQGVLRAVDRHVPGGSGASIALATKDVYRFLSDSATRQDIEDGVAQAIHPGEPTVVLSHSLGTVVAYDVLRREAAARGWVVPTFITVGSPLGVSEIRKRMRALSPLAFPPGTTAWSNAMDERDVVALYPLTPNHFPVTPALPAIHNKTDVRNGTPNRHGISGYLGDPEVARWILEAVSA